MKRNKKTIYWIIGIALTIFIVFLIISSQNQSITTYIFDNQTGIISMTFTKCGWLCKMFTQQTFTLAKASYSVGDTITLTYGVTNFEKTINNPYADIFICGQEYTRSLPIIPYGTFYTNKVSFPVTQTMLGSNTMRTCAVKFGYHYGNTYNIVWDPLQTITIQQVATACAPSKLLSTVTLGPNSAGVYGGNVPNVNNQVNRQVMCELWRKETLSAENCIATDYCRITYTQCSEGYVISGTSNTQSDGIKNCVAPAITPPSIPTATCNDGLLNGDEIGIDCGGSCSTCAVTPGVTATCNDGLQNGNELGVDCGGICTACTGTGTGTDAGTGNGAGTGTGTGTGTDAETGNGAPPIIETSNTMLYIIIGIIILVVVIIVLLVRRFR